MVKKQQPRPRKIPSKGGPPPTSHQQQRQHRQHQEQHHHDHHQPSIHQHHALADTRALRAHHHQRLLDIFAHAFLDLLASPALHHTLRTVKQALFDRDFGAAFASEAHLRVYAARWSPTRALCYAAILSGIAEHLEELCLPDPLSSSSSSSSSPSSSTSSTSSSSEPSLSSGSSTSPPAGSDSESAPEPEPKPEPQPELESGSGSESVSQNRHDAESHASSERNSPRTLRVLAIGGCAAEQVALAAYLHDASSPSSPRHGSLTLIDSAPWASVITTLQERITSPPLLSKYASAAAKAANKPPLAQHDQLSTTFAQHDVLSLSADQLRDLIAGDKGGQIRSPVLVTLMFTLNELYTDHGIGKTTTFLRTLGEVVPQGSLLLVVDSPGSYSEAAVGRDKKKYPMQWLLDHTLTARGDKVRVPRAGGEEDGVVGCKWRRLESTDSAWFRLPEGLAYPIQLENMRYQMHLYRREGDVGTEERDR